MQKVKNTVISNIQVFIITSAAIIKKNISQGLAKYCLNANGQNSVMKQCMVTGMIHLGNVNGLHISRTILVTVLHFLCFIRALMSLIG